MTDGENRATIERLYTAMALHDAEAMAACYAPGATFTDPVFVDLRDGEPQDMWRMLVGRAGDMTVDLLEHDASGGKGSARWVARYTFSQTGRKVVNDVRSQFTFDDAGLIADQQDDFAFWRWARWACSPAGRRCCSTRCATRPAPASPPSAATADR
jgi:hypothetical protein